MDTAAEIRRLRASIANLRSIVDELERKNDASSRAEAARQRQLIAGLEAEIRSLQ